MWHPPQVRCDETVSSIGAATARRSCSCAPAPWSEATPPWRIVKDNGAQGAITGTTRKGEPQRAWHLKHHATDRNAALSYHAGSGQLVKPLRLESSSESLGIRPRNDNSNQKYLAILLRRQDTGQAASAVQKQERENEMSPWSAKGSYRRDRTAADPPKRMSEQRV